MLPGLCMDYHGCQAVGRQRDVCYAAQQGLHCWGRPVCEALMPLSSVAVYWTAGEAGAHRCGASAARGGAGGARPPPGGCSRGGIRPEGELCCFLCAAVFSLLETSAPRINVTSHAARPSPCGASRCGVWAEDMRAVTSALLLTNTHLEAGRAVPTLM